MHIMRRLSIIKKLLNDNKKIKSDTPFWLNFLFLTRGFTCEKIKLYKLNNSNYKLYLSDYQRRLSSTINGIYSSVLDNKLFFESLFKEYFRIPHNYLIILKGKAFSLCDSSEEMTKVDIFKLLEEKRKLVIKPVIGGKGEGVRIISYSDNIIKINRTIVSHDDFIKMTENLDNYIVCEFIEQDEYARNLFADTTNTIRMLFYRNPETRKMCLFGATQRMGGIKTKGLDNFSSGGAIAKIDIETGLIGDVVIIKNNWNMSFSDTHPDSGTKVKGIRIPNWTEIKEDITRKLDNISFIQYIGLDIVIADNWYYVIEGNNFPEPRIIQIFKPLLQDPEVVKFYKYHNIIR